MLSILKAVIAMLLYIMRGRRQEIQRFVTDQVQEGSKMSLTHMRRLYLQEVNHCHHSRLGRYYRSTFGEYTERWFATFHLPPHFFYCSS